MRTLWGRAAGCARRGVANQRTNYLSADPATNESVVLAVRVGSDLQTTVQRQLLHDVAHVTLDRMRGDLQSRRDLLVAQALGNEVDHLTLARGHSYGFNCVRPPRVHCFS